METIRLTCPDISKCHWTIVPRVHPLSQAEPSDRLQYKCLESLGWLAAWVDHFWSRNPMIGLAAPFLILSGLFWDMSFWDNLVWILRQANSSSSVYLTSGVTKLFSVDSLLITLPWAALLVPLVHGVCVCVCVCVCVVSVQCLMFLAFDVSFKSVSA